MRMLVLSRYSRLGASSRLRTMQYLPSVADAGIEVEVAPFFDDAYLKRLYAGEPVGLATAGYYFARLRHIMRCRKPDLIWIEKETFPWLPWPVERAILPRNVAVVADYDDAVFHRYDLHRHAAVRTVLGCKINGVMGAANLVMVGNQYLADRAKAAGAKHVEIVPTVVDTNVYGTQRHPPGDGRLRIGWIGSPSTWTDYFAPMIPMVAAVATRHGAIIRAVGAAGSAEPSPVLECLPWSEDTEVSLIQSMDIGLMPLDDSPWARGKCGYKLIQYMACGLPVIASPVGVNSEIVEEGVNGFLVRTEQEWEEAIARLVADKELRKRMGKRGREKIVNEYSLQVQAPRLVKLIKELVNNIKV